MNKFIENFETLSDGLLKFAQALFYFSAASTCIYGSIHLHHALPITKLYKATASAILEPLNK